MPQRAAGCRIEPPVSLPREPAAIPAATATALPPLEPPAVRVGSQGFFIGPKALFSPDEPIANSSMFVLPTSTASAARSRATTVASYGGRQPVSAPEPPVPSALRRVRIFEAQVVGASAVHKASLIAMGTPLSLPKEAPLARLRSTAAAAASAASRDTCKKACKPLWASMRCSARSVSATALISPLLTFCACWAIGKSRMSLIRPRTPARRTLHLRCVVLRVVRRHWPGLAPPCPDGAEHRARRLASSPRPTPYPARRGSSRIRGCSRDPSACDRFRCPRARV